MLKEHSMLNDEPGTARAYRGGARTQRRAQPALATPDTWEGLPPCPRRSRRCALHSQVRPLCSVQRLEVPPFRRESAFGGCQNDTGNIFLHSVASGCLVGRRCPPFQGAAAWQPSANTAKPVHILRARVRHTAPEPTNPSLPSAARLLPASPAFGAGLLMARRCAAGRSLRLGRLPSVLNPRTRRGLSWCYRKTSAPLQGSSLPRAA